jgi:hypothetical protein
MNRAAVMAGREEPYPDTIGEEVEDAPTSIFDYM